MRKFAWTFYKINTCLQKTTTCIRLQAGQIFLVNLYIHSFQFWGWFLQFLSCVTSKNSSFLLYYIYELKKCLRFLKSYFKLEILIFLSLVDVKLKSSFSDKKKSAVKSETHFSREAIENQCESRSWSSAKLFTVQNYIENANGNVPLKLENVPFSFFEFKMRTLFLYKRFFYSMTIM